MHLIAKKLEQDGAFLFRWRSYLPLVVLPLGLVALFESVRVEAAVGTGMFHAWTLFSLAVSFLGLAIRWLTVSFVPWGTSGRNTKEQRAVVLNTTGIYATVRNPLYLGNFLAYLGVVMLPMVWWFILIVCLAYWLYIERIIAAEEAFLAGKFGKEYTDWVALTPAFLPKPGNWTRPALTFSLKTLLRREYNGVLAIALAFFVLDLIRGVAIKGMSLGDWLAQEWFLVWVLGAAALLFAVLWTLKKTTNVLTVSR